MLLVASVGTASAECAWVLWVTDAQERHSPFDSFTSLAECQKAIYSPSWKKTVEEGKQQGHGLVPMCLPDTVDPRGPKGR